METLSIDILRDEMENWLCPDNVFVYQGKEYYFGHSNNDGITLA